jgi:CxxC motif-containing protein (DUF1111 family)/predicted lipoprotein with Yx(FWY)xxD motif
MTLCLALMACFTHAAGPIYGDGDIVTDGSINISDYLRASRIVLGEVDPSEQELSHGDLYPPAAPDGVVNLQDLLLLQLKLAQQPSYSVETLALFADGPATLSVDVGGTAASTTLVVDGDTGLGASVTNNPNFIDPDDSANTLWYVSISDGIASVYLSTSDLSADDILDSGFDLSGDGAGELVFDLKVNSLSPGATFTVKIDSGALAFGRVALVQQSLTVGSWQRVAISFTDLLADQGPGPGVDLSNVVNVFVIEVTGGDADFYLDNIFVSHSCPQDDVCNATIKTKPVFSDIDGDGIGDSLDQCPATPVATVVDASGCPLTVSLLSGAATASSFGAAGGPSLASDGNMATRWESAHGIDPSWIVFDLGANHTLSEVIIHWEAASAASYEVQGSTDNISWTVLASQSGGVFGDRTDNLNLSGTYRYVRMYGLFRSSPYGYSIWEMEVYGSPASDADGDGVDDIIDLCPGTLWGSSVDASGCIFIDTDNDGVRDSLDQCPSSPPVTLVNAIGCAVIVPVNEVASINGILAGGEGSSQPGFSLYVFDNDPVGTSTCNGSCAIYWPPLLVADGGASGVSDLGTITRSDGSLQASYQGRPLYFYIDDAVPGDTAGDGVGGVWDAVAYSQTYAPLFNGATVLEPVLREDTPAALITRLADRARDRHAREDQFQIYDHYLSFYWEHRTAEIEIIDTIGKGGSAITFNVTTEWPLNSREAELRFFHLTAAIYANNGVMSAVPGLDVPGETRRHYTRSVSLNPLTGTALRVGDRMEFELSQFLTGTPNGRDNYYGTAILYIVGQGVVPWEAKGLSQSSFPMPAEAKLGGNTTLNYQYSDEPDNHFMQMPTNLSNINGQNFVLGRRVHHTDFEDGSHNEAITNPPFLELANKLGAHYVNHSCVSCHARNGRALPPATGQILEKYVVKVGDAGGKPDPLLGAVLQPQAVSGAPEGTVSISSWTQSNGLRSPNFSFAGVTPTNFSARIAPQLVGMGLLEAITEADIEALADPTDSDGDGISGRLQLVTDAITGQLRIGRFGWKGSMPSVKQQVASALNTDMGVMTSMLPSPDCGTLQTSCGPSGIELTDQHLDTLSAYVALLGVSARRDLADPVALQGEGLFASAGCGSCHADTFQTSAYHPHAELRDQTIHPYTDLLLHDMGPGLASTLTEGRASGSEWRTAPLWNIGLTAGVSFGEAYLHDGRARTLDEAILWHGGEGQSAKQAYSGMSQTDKDALITFLKTL